MIENIFCAVNPYQASIKNFICIISLCNITAMHSHFKNYVLCHYTIASIRNSYVFYHSPMLVQCSCSNLVRCIFTFEERIPEASLEHRSWLCLGILLLELENSYGRQPGPFSATVKLHGIQHGQTPHNLHGSPLILVVFLLPNST